MNDPATVQMLENLKEYFKKEELSDRILHIVELEDFIISKPSREQRKIDLTEKSDSHNNETEPSPTLLVKTQDHQTGEGDTGVKETSADDEVPQHLDEVVEPLQLFSDFTFFVHDSLDVGYVTNIIVQHGGSIGLLESCDFVINVAVYSEESTPDARERTVKWLLDSVNGLEIKPLLEDVVYSPIQIKTKPLLGKIIAFDQAFKIQEKNVFTKLVEVLGGTSHDPIFESEEKNISTVTCTHLIVKRGALKGKQHDIAMKRGILCITKDWLLECVATESCCPVDNFLAVNDDNDQYFEKKNAFSIFPIHALVLCIGSSYFNTLLSRSGMKETKQNNVIVKVNKGEGRYLEMLINTFYNHVVINDFGSFDLLKVLEVADRFLCDIFIKRGLERLKNIHFLSFDECNKVFERVLVIESSGSDLANEAYAKYKQICLEYLVDYFSPLESKLEKHQDFEKLSFQTLVTLLQCGKTLLWNENSLVYFIEHWLAADETRQTEENIEALLNEVRFEHFSPEFINDGISLTHAIFSKWKKYLQWHKDVLIFHALSAQAKIDRKFPIARPNRSRKSDDTNVQSNVVQLLHTGDGIFKPSNSCNILYRGYVLTPVVIIKESTELNKMVVTLFLYYGALCKEEEIPNFHLQFPVVFDIFLGNKESFGAYGSSLVRQHSGPLDIIFSQRNVVKCCVGTVYNLSYERFQHNGIYASFAFKSTVPVTVPVQFAGTAASGFSFGASTVYRR